LVAALIFASISPRMKLRVRRWRCGGLPPPGDVRDRRQERDLAWLLVDPAPLVAAEELEAPTARQPAWRGALEHRLLHLVLPIQERDDEQGCEGEKNGHGPS
jgi:hypothetical protein